MQAKPSVAILGDAGDLGSGLARAGMPRDRGAAQADIVILCVPIPIDAILTE
jgi:hypothetical protein